MKKITLLLFMLLAATSGYSQLAQEGFEGTWPPTGWGIYNNGSGLVQSWKHTDPLNTFYPPYEGTYAAFVDRETAMPGNDTPQDWLVTPSVSLPANAQLRFFSRLTLNGDNGGLYRIMVSTSTDASDLDAYTEVVEWEELDLNPVQTEYNEVVVSLSSFAAGTSVYIAFVMEGNNADRWLVDNVTVVEECLVPENLMAEDMGLNSAHLTWDAGASTAWEVEVLPVDDVTTGTGVSVTGTAEYDPTTLIENTDYKFYVKSVCEEGVNESEWAGPYFFSTVGLGDTCAAPLEITSLPFSTTDNTFNYGDDYDGIPGLSCVPNEWSAYLSGDDVVYSYTAPADGTISVDLTDVLQYSGIFIYSSCDDIGVNCLDGAYYDWNEIPASIPNFAVTAGTTYYFVISTYASPQSTPYTLLIQEVHCEKPVGLPTTNIGLTSVDLSWDEMGTATSWEYVVQAPGSGVPAGAGTTADSNTNFPVSGLTAATPYEYYVRADCGDGTFSAWAGPYLFNTMVCEVEDQCTLTFILTSQWGGFDDNTMNVSQNGVTLAVLGPDFTWEDGTGPVEVEVQVCNGMPVDLFWNAGGWSNQVGVAIRNSFDQIIYEKAIGEGASGTLLYSETVNCDTPMCLPPTSLAVSNETMTTADLSWLGTETGEWDYYIVEAGGDAPTDATEGTSTTENPVTADGLEAATNYEYYVRYVCSDTENSAWAGPFAFNTEVCNPEDKCTFVFEMTSVGGWGWESNTMTVSQGGVPVATIGDTFTWGASGTVEIPLCPDVEIEVFWNVGGWGPDDKGLVIYSPFAEDVYTMTPGTETQGTVVIEGPVSCDPPPCPKPQNLTATDLQLNSALLGWDEMGTATTWEIWVLPYGSPEPTEPGEVTTDNPYLAESLDSGTPYVFYVRANCGDEDGYSTWSGPFAFTTAIENNDCANATEAPVNPGVDCIESVTGTVTGANSSGTMASCNWQAPAYDVWYSFTATEATHSVSINNMEGGYYYMNIYEGADCDALTDIYCGYDTATTVSGLTPGETYYIQVFADYLNNPTAPTSFELCVLTPASIIADNTTYSVEEIVTEILITSECAQVSNISWSTGTSNDWGGENGIAMFDKGMSGFPMQKGVILATGNAMSSPGPNTNTLSEGFWPGDEDLFNYITESGIDPDLWSYNDATVLEFDFVPLTNHISFPFVFASEEYGTYQCSFSDAFAFFLTDVTNGTPTENLAVIPGTDIPVSVVTIRNSMYNSGCGDANVDYFDSYYDLGDMSAPINYNGNTVLMAAEADVVMGNTYHIKLVIADRNDNSMDSAVFIGPFDIGQINLGDDLLVENGNALCEGGEYVLDSGLDPEDYEIIWTHTDANGVETELEETGTSVVITEPGTYTISATYLSSTCIGNDSVVIEYFPTVNEAVDLFACDSSGFDTFDLTQNEAVILAGFNAADYEVTYYLTEEDALAEENAVDASFTNTVQFGQPVFARVEGLVTGCVSVKPFNIVVEDNPPQFTVTDDFSICEGTSGTITVTPVDFDLADVTISWTRNDEGLADTTASITVTEGGVYEVTVNNNGCLSTAAIQVTLVEMPVADMIEDLTSCGAYVLPALSENNNYYTGPDGTGDMLAVGDEITTDQTVYIFAQVPGTECSDESSFMVTVVPAPQFEVSGDCINNEFVLQVNFLDGTYSSANVMFEWFDPTGATVTTETTVVATMQGAYQVTITPTEYDEACPFVMEYEVENPNCMIQKGISPNGDTMNDNFDLTGFNVSKLSIFNRYGEEVYSKSNYIDEWYGQSDNGKELPTGTYYYAIERVNGDSKTGWIYINREEN